MNIWAAHCVNNVLYILYSYFINCMSMFLPFTRYLLTEKLCDFFPNLVRYCFTIEFCNFSQNTDSLKIIEFTMFPFLLYFHITYGWQEDEEEPTFDKHKTVLHYFLCVPSVLKLKMLIKNLTIAKPQIDNHT